MKPSVGTFAEKAHVRALRRAGLSYGRIHQLTGFNRWTIRDWCRGVVRGGEASAPQRSAA